MTRSNGDRYRLFFKFVPAPASQETHGQCWREVTNVEWAQSPEEAVRQAAKKRSGARSTLWLALNESTGKFGEYRSTEQTEIRVQSTAPEAAEAVAA